MLYLLKWYIGMDHSKFDKRKTTKQCGISKGTDETLIATKLAE
jgi:hypothetical protein